eukprot:3149548-Amphidinium_carterae.1
MSVPLKLCALVLTACLSHVSEAISAMPLIRSLFTEHVLGKGWVNEMLVAAFEDARVMFSSTDEEPMEIINAVHDSKGF